MNPTSVDILDSVTPTTPVNMTVTASPSRVTRALLLVIALLVLSHLASEAVATVWSEPVRLRHFFSLNSEAAPGAWFSSLQILLCALLLGVIARQGFMTIAPIYWWGLAIGFGLLALDEGAQVHELFTPMMQALIGNSGISRQGWILVAVPIVAVAGLLYLRFLFSLPRSIAAQFIFGAVVFIAGAVVIELLTSFYKEAEAARSASCQLNGPCGYLYSVMVAAEEALEMLGIAIFANALLKILESMGTQLRVKFSE
jgi:hypothetical protein